MPPRGVFPWLISFVIDVSMLILMAVCIDTSQLEAMKPPRFSDVAGFVVLLLAVMALKGLFADFTMSISPNGIKRRFLFRPVNIPWAEVREVSQQEVGVLIRLPRRKIIIPHVRYQLKPPKLYGWIIDKIPDTERQRILNLHS